MARNFSLFSSTDIETDVLLVKGVFGYLGIRDRLPCCSNRCRIGISKGGTVAEGSMR